MNIIETTNKSKLESFESTKWLSGGLLYLTQRKYIITIYTSSFSNALTVPSVINFS